MQGEVTIREGLVGVLALLSSAAALTCVLLFAWSGDIWAAVTFAGGALSLGVWASVYLTDAAHRPQR